MSHKGPRSANATPTSTPSPKKRQLPQIPNYSGRDRGMNMLSLFLIQKLFSNFSRANGSYIL